MPPEQWSDTMILAMEMGLPGSLAAAGVALGLPEDKLKDPVGKSLIQYFSKPCRPTKANGGRTRNLPEHDPDKWKLYIEYNRQDVVTEMAIRSKLLPLAPSEQKLWCLDQRMNDHGVRIDLPMAEKIVRYDGQNRARLQEEAHRITGLQNPNSVAQLKGWLARQGTPVEQLRKDDLDWLLSEDLPDDVRRVLEIRKALGKTSVKKYGAMLAATCGDSRLRGILQFYGANRSGRWAGRIVQTHNLARNELPDLDLARELAAAGDFDTLETLFGETSFVFSELIRTAFIPSEGCRFVVSDFSAIEARVVAWLAGEQWVLDAFRAGEDIYCKTASMMYHVPVVKHGVNGHLRQKGKVAVLACSYQGGVGAMKAMDKGGTIPEEELQSVVDQWRRANPMIVRLWRDYERAARTAIEERRPVHRPLRGRSGVEVVFSYERGNLFIKLPSGRRLCYWGARLREDPQHGGREQIVYMGVNQETKQWGIAETYGGKLVENCLAGDTLVYTSNGLKCLLEVDRADLLWDGSEWVQHEGLIEKGLQETIDLDGVRMTPDHRVYTREGWRNASSCEGYHRAEVRLPDRAQLCGIRRKEEPLEREVRGLRQNGDTRGDGASEGRTSVLRMPAVEADLGKAEAARTVRDADLERMAFNEAEMRKPGLGSLAQLRGPRDKGLRELVKKLRCLLPGHAARIPGRPDPGPDRCERGLLPGKLPLGNVQAAGPEPEDEPDDKYALGRYDLSGGVGAVEDRHDHAVLQAGSRSAGCFAVRETGHKEPVYDIRNAGPRHCFTVLSSSGPMLVHNCTQAIARDCLAEAMTRVSDMGYQIVMHVHDEMIVDVPLEDTDALQRINRAMGEEIPWAPGLPLRGDGYECDFYKKD